LQVNPNLRFTLASLNQYYTRLTVHDLPPAHAARISVTSWTSMAPKIAAKQHDAVVMAGGPLMDIQETRGIAAYFEAFARKGKPCVMEGCGIGPLHVPRFRDNVLQIGRLATSIRLRDSDSRVRLQELGINKLITIRPDPSTRFIRETGIGWSPGSGGPIRCYFRELTPEYLQSTSPAAAEELLSATLQKLLAWYPDATIELLAMHFFPIGWDDRVLARRLCQLIADPRLRFVQAPLSPQEILESMASARFCVCMRFHSVVFAHTIGCRFAAIDYTDGGKIRGFLKDNGLGDKLIRLPDLDTLTLAAFEAALGTEKRGRLAEQRGA
jgi:polysaccharide pyruvyl transferase WcaK-like protein